MSVHDVSAMRVGLEIVGIKDKACMLSQNDALYIKCDLFMYDIYVMNDADCCDTYIAFIYENCF